MYPLLLKAAVKERLWGGDRLIKEFGFESDSFKAAEAWVLSCHKDGHTIVKNGQYTSLTLNEALQKMGKDALGKNAQRFPYFPLLVKLIDAKDRLSIQVHPDDDYAFKNEGEYGKTTLWYVLDCDEKAQIIYGLNRNITSFELEKRVKDNTIGHLCNYVNVKRGDVFFIPAGTIHAIGKGILIAEIQQNSNTTYRISDYGRLGADGKPRPLHIKKAIDVIKPSLPSKPYGNVGELTLYPFGIVRNLAKCEFFTSELLSLDGKAGLFEKDSFMSLLFCEGEGTLCYSGGSMRVKKGDSVFVPAGIRITINGKAEIICSYI
ncbi:MAG: class I mannose-6-phosphate isomerase [Clostridia bacterium]|nr:class I mannose-6-phosphate isomerase [Clostridia bacterium]